MALPIHDLKSLHGWTLCYLTCSREKCFLMYNTKLWNHVFMIIALCNVPDTTEESLTLVSLLSAPCTTTGCCSSPLPTRLSKPDPQPIPACCSKPWTSCPSFTLLSKFLICFFKWRAQNHTAHCSSSIIYMWEYLSWYFMRIKLLHILQTWEFKVRDYESFYLCPMASTSRWKELH